MTVAESEFQGGAGTPAPQARAAIRLLRIERFRGIEALTWRPGAGMNIILGGGDAGKTSILEAVALLLSPTNPATVPDTDYHDRNVEAGFVIEAVMDLPAESGIDYQFKPSWPWEWNGEDAGVPTDVEGGPPAGPPVYRVRVRGTADLELVYEIIQPDDTPDGFSVPLRRAIGLVRLGGDDRNDRDLRLVQGSALDRLLSDKSLRSRIAAALSTTEIRTKLLDDKQLALASLDTAFANEKLPSGLDLSIIGGQGASIASMIGLTAAHDGVQLPVASWGSGTRRLSALAIAEQNQGSAPITIVDEIERGLEPYRQHALMGRLHSNVSQVFATTHSPFVISAAKDASFWYVDSKGVIGGLDGKKIATARATQPAVFLARLSLVAEGATEVGFVSALLERALGSNLAAFGIEMCDGGSNDETLELLEALTESGLTFGGFADNDNKHPTRWQALQEVCGSLLFRWDSGCIEDNIIAAVPDAQLEAFIPDPDDEKTGYRRRTLAIRLGIDDTSFVAIANKAGDQLKDVIIAAAGGRVPDDKKDDKAARKEYKNHGQTWFKTLAGGRELEQKLFSSKLWPGFRERLLPFCNAVRAAVGLPALSDLS